jgi:hypothetical protein
MNEGKWEIAYTASGITNAKIVVGRLETEGIPTRLKYEAVGAIYAITIDGLGEVDILVPVNYLEKAREVLSRTYNEQDIDWEKS